MDIHTEPKFPKVSFSSLPFETRPLETAGFLRLPQVLRLWPVSRSSWWLGVKQGKYPQPVKLGPNTTAWRTADILKLLERAAAAERHAA